MKLIAYLTKNTQLHRTKRRQNNTPVKQQIKIFVQKNQNPLNLKIITTPFSFPVTISSRL